MLYGIDVRGVAADGAAAHRHGTADPIAAGNWNVKPAAIVFATCHR